MIYIFLIIEVLETKWLLLCLLSTQISPGGVQDSCSSSTKKTGSEPAVKKPRIETPSPLPTFKVGIDSSRILINGIWSFTCTPAFRLITCLQVRKEKLGDRITALQQLVSPFGKVSSLFFFLLSFVSFSLSFCSLEEHVYLHVCLSATHMPFLLYN